MGRGPLGIVSQQIATSEFAWFLRADASDVYAIQIVTSLASAPSRRRRRWR